MNDGTEVGNPPGADSSGLYSINRTLFNLYTVKRDNVLLASPTTVSRALVNSNIYFGHGTGGNSQELAAYGIGALTSSQETTFYNNLHTLLHTFGAI